jgi:hypothetical protein
MSGFKKIQDTVTAKLEKAVKNTFFFEQFISKTFIPNFQYTQKKRWSTLNVSEGKQWEPLNSTYEAWKKKKYASSFGKGQNLMIATGRLFKSLTLDREGEYDQAITSNTLVLNFNVEYAAYAGSIRPILQFSMSTRKKWKQLIANHMRKVWQLKTS